MITSKTSLFNQALGRLGEVRISDAESNSENKAIILREFYQQSIDEVLREYPWSFAIARSVLALDAGSNSTSHDYKFQLPGDCLRVLNTIDVYGGTYANVSDSYSIEGEYLYCGYEEIGIRYIKKITLAGKLDSLVAEAVVLNLAVKSAYAITEDKALAGILEAKYEKALYRAKNADGIERVNRAELTENWVDVG